MEILSIHSGGIVKDELGRPMAEIFFRVVTKEGEPEILVGHCLPCYQKSVIKSLKRLAWRRVAKPKIAKPEPRWTSIINKMKPSSWLPSSQREKARPA